LPDCHLGEAPPAGTRDRLKELGAEGFAQWMLEQKQVLITDTTLRDAHQSLFATRMRTQDMLAVAPHYARLGSGLFSLECWGGATFDVSMRFLKEDPWQRLAELRAAIPNVLLQMLLRASNAVGYTNYPDNVVRHFIRQAADGGIDLFRVFDSLNWVDNMRVAIDAVRDTGALCEAAICYTGDIFDTSRPRYNLRYYVNMAKELERAGAHILAIKDMAGICKPRAVRELVKALKNEVGLPIHFHTHDTSGIAAASVLAAVEAGVDAVDAALDAMSGLTSQPNLGSIVAALEGSERDPGLDRAALQQLSTYWEGVRKFYAPFEADLRAGTSDVYRHEMPGGQVTNLREQARSLGLEARWPEVAEAYAQVNLLFGDIVKVTPTSKVVGDMALFMVSNGLTPEDVLDPTREIDFPESVVSLFKGELGYPAHGFPAVLQRKVLKGRPALTRRAGELLAPVELTAEKAKVEKNIGREISEAELASHLMYPKVFQEFAEHQARYGDVSALPTTAFFYGLAEGGEISVELERGKTLVIQLLGAADTQDGHRKLFFELNGQPRLIKVAKEGVQAASSQPQADADNPHHVGAPMPGMVSTVHAKAGQPVAKGDTLLTIVAMKMEVAIKAERDGTVKQVLVAAGDKVTTRDLVAVFE
jgi:pyruvate carboxylase